MSFYGGHSNAVAAMGSKAHFYRCDSLAVQTQMIDLGSRFEHNEMKESRLIAQAGDRVAFERGGRVLSFQTQCQIQ